MLDFYKGKNIFVTGHTGFKGSWLCKCLTMAGANVTGYALQPPTFPSLFDLADLSKEIHSVEGDIRNLKQLKKAFLCARPEIVFHLAAQPIVLAGYEKPAYTYETNVMGTVNILECVRSIPCVKSFVNVTTDKVYQNHEWCWGYRETDELNGRDPYSNSKSCSELVTSCYQNSFFHSGEIAVSTARAGNVIGGGDFADHRIIPDCVRAAKQEKPITLRNPNSVRPYQHVLEAVSAYLMLAQAQEKVREYAGSYNVGPDESDCLSTGQIANLFCEKWGNHQTWQTQISSDKPKEANYLKLDCSKIKSTLRWRPYWNIRQAVAKTVEWYQIWDPDGPKSQQSVIDCMERQIQEFFQRGD